VKLRWFAFLVVLLAGCSSKQDYKNPPWNAEVPVKRAMQWMPISEKAGAAWGVSPQLITAIMPQLQDAMFIAAWAGAESRRPVS